ncbi:rCG48782 [Rattus norvegicus]|uniref:RCG48782 n=1 Tax=Rattus norvegicus TaxID=10116 RepID=A6IFG1_RAT|nr:rCG48782 [Rattus norvegicus]
MSTLCCMFLLKWVILHPTTSTDTGKTHWTCNAWRYHFRPVETQTCLEVLVT